jgi:hypothetical protein
MESWHERLKFLTESHRGGKFPTMKSATLDSKRRLVMPEDCPPRSLVTIHSVDKNTWVVHRQKPSKRIKMITVPIITELPDDPEWEKTEGKIGRHIARRIPEPEE